MGDTLCLYWQLSIVGCAEGLLRLGSTERRLLLATTLRLRFGRAAIIALGIVVVLAASVLLPRFVGDLGLGVVLLLVIGFLALSALFLVPVHFLPATALAVFALVPPRVLPQDGLFGALPLTTIILVVWAGRRLVLGHGSEATGERMSRSSAALRLRARATEHTPFRTSAITFGAGFLLWSVFSLVRSSDTGTSTGWLISFTAGALVPLVVPNLRREARALERTWLVLGLCLGAYATVEAAIRFNPVWGTLYSVLGLSDSQVWAVYRANASFGHPLFAALFFAVACSIAVGSWLTTRSRWTLAAAVFSGLGLVSTVSRGAMLALAVSLGVAYILALAIRGVKRWSRFVGAAVLAVVGVIGVFQFDAFTARNDSAEAQLSSGARDLGLWVTLRATELTGGLGSGPGTSGITGRLFDDVVIENSLLQLIISVGFPGLVLFVGLLTSLFLHALSRRAVGIAAGILAYAITISAFNAIDALRPMHLLLGCLIILALGTPSLAIDPPPDDARRPKRDRAAESTTRPVLAS